MKFGVREICDVVLKAKAATKIGNKVFYKDEPVIYFDSLKTSSMEGAATTVYAQGGRGNSRLVAWEGERTVTFTMEDALISAEGFMILSGAGLIEAKNGAPIYQHMTEITNDIDSSKVEEASPEVHIYLANKPHTKNGENLIYVMTMANGEVDSEPFIAYSATLVEDEGEHKGMYDICIKEVGSYKVPNLSAFKSIDSVLVDYYVAKESGAKQIEITPDKFGGNYYLEASTLFRDTNGVDLPAEFIVPNCKIQSNFTFTMASSGDPSTFTFTMDAFPDYTRFDKTKKVLAAIQIIDVAGSSDLSRTQTDHDVDHEKLFN